MIRTMKMFIWRDGPPPQHQIWLPRVGEVKLNPYVLPLLVLVANIIVATIAWVVVGALLR
jgi:hypothetical protein